MSDPGPKEQWNQREHRHLAAEQIIIWLEGIRTLTIEVWKKNPELRKRWEKNNKKSASARS